MSVLGKYVNRDRTHVMAKHSQFVESICPGIIWGLARKWGLTLWPLWGRPGREGGALRLRHTGLSLDCRFSSFLFFHPAYMQLPFSMYPNWQYHAGSCVPKGLPFYTRWRRGKFSCFHWSKVGRKYSRVIKLMNSEVGLQRFKSQLSLL